MRARRVVDARARVEHVVASRRVEGEDGRARAVCAVRVRCADDGGTGGEEFECDLESARALCDALERAATRVRALGGDVADAVGDRAGATEGGGEAVDRAGRTRADAEAVAREGAAEIG